MSAVNLCVSLLSKECKSRRGYEAFGKIKSGRRRLIWEGKGPHAFSQAYTNRSDEGSVRVSNQKAFEVINVYWSDDTE
jgi:hypothetical protein